MPRINRRLRLRTGTLTDEMRWALLYGLDRGCVQAEEQAETRSAWQNHRAELMATDLGPGRRPWGFFVFELNVRPARLLDEIDILRHHGLIDTAEAIGIENHHPILDPGVTAKHCRRFETIELINSQQLSITTVRRYQQNFAIGGRWHRWRGQPDMAARFERFSLACAAWAASQGPTGDWQN